MKSNKDVITKEKINANDEKLLKSINKLTKENMVNTNTLTVVKRKGSIVPFNRERIENALKAAFRDTKNLPKDSPLPLAIENTINRLTAIVEDKSKHLGEKGVTLTVEGIQDLVEITLMKNDFHDVARDYILYRDRQRELRSKETKYVTIVSADGITKRRFNPMKISSSLESLFRNHHNLEGQTDDHFISSINDVIVHITNYVFEMEQDSITRDALEEIIENSLMALGFYEEAKRYIRSRSYVTEEKKQTPAGKVFLIKGDKGSTYTITENDIEEQISHSTRDIENVDVKDLTHSALLNFYEGITEEEVDTALIMAARSKIEMEPNYTFVTAKLLLEKIYRETLECSSREKTFESSYREYFISYIQKGISVERLSKELYDFDLNALSKALVPQRDYLLQYLGLQTLYDRYFIHHKERRLETPQIFWMRVCMGLSIKEEKKTEKAIEFYNILSKLLYSPGTPTLFNSGTNHAQLSSCYLSTINDDLSHIFKVIADDAQLSKWAGGLGNDWTSVRATGALIKGTNGKSQGVIPFLKVANDTAVAVNQGGKRKGALCSYLETWHLDIENFLELRKNTGDERRRTHDMNTANWIPDLFMQRVEQDKQWTLFSPNDVPDLHELYGKAFQIRYEEYEKQVEEGKIALYRKLDAKDLWRKMLSMLYETGHPWITFKDPSNIRSPQSHVGVVHSSNLCTEILLNTSKEEVAVCNLGSVNLIAHLNDNNEIDEKMLEYTVTTAIRMLDNVIDINFYPIPEAQNSNAKHRPIGLGLMGFQDLLHRKSISYASFDAAEIADDVMEKISFYAIKASALLAKERGTYLSYKGSKWDLGMLPIDTIDLLEAERGEKVDMNKTFKKDWNSIRDLVKKYGMRNSNTMAIAPTATIGNILGVSASIDPNYKNLYVKSNLSGEFTVANTYLINDLKKLGIWDKEMLDDLKYFDGSIAEIERIPDTLKKIYLTAFEVDSLWLIECGSRRQKWIDMGQSMNLFLAEPSGKKLHEMYFAAWKKGIKTTYYLRSMAATTIEKSTTDINKRGLQPRWMKNKSASSRIEVDRKPKIQACSMEEGCESCQ
jgi:ribonucleoside-diphosphate reductase alpha chain